MAKYMYPAVFTAEEGGLYSVNFPDLESCYTCGDDLPDAMNMAEDVLALILHEYELTGRSIPLPSEIKKIPAKQNEFIKLICADTLTYQ